MEWSAVPLINWLEPFEEREAASHICSQLRRLTLHVQTFQAAIELIDHCEELTAAHKASPDSDNWSVRARFGDWMLITARDAAFTVYHYQSVLRSIRDQLHRAPTLQSKTDTKAIEHAYEQFKADFPSWKSVRDAVGHWADMGFKPEDFEEHRVPGEPFIQSTFDPRTRSLIMTRHKGYRMLAVTEENYRRLVAITQAVFAAFRKAAVPPPAG